MIPRTALKPGAAGRTVFRPSMLLETVPWLMIAAAMRVIVFGGGFAALPAGIVANAAIFIALLLAARRMIEIMDGTTTLGHLAFRDQLALAYRVLHPVGILIIAIYAGLAV